MMRIDMLATQISCKDRSDDKENKDKDRFLDILNNKVNYDIDSKNIESFDDVKNGDKKTEESINEILAILLNGFNIKNIQKLKSMNAEVKKEDLEKGLENINTIKRNIEKYSYYINEIKKNIDNVINIENISTDEIKKIKNILEFMENNEPQYLSKSQNKDNIINVKVLEGNFIVDNNSLSELKNYIFNMFNTKKQNTNLSSNNETLMVNRSISKFSKGDIDVLSSIALKDDKFNNKNFNMLSMKSNTLDNGKEKEMGLGLKSKINNISENESNNDLYRSIGRNIGITSIDNIVSNNLNRGINENMQPIIRREFLQNDIVQAMNYLKNSNSEEINVTMNPKELGSMTIKIIKTDNKSSYIINIANKDTLSMIKDNINDIKTHLINMNSNNGEGTVEVKLSYLGSGFNESGSRKFNESKNREEKRGKFSMKEDTNELENQIVEDRNINLLI